MPFILQVHPVTKLYKHLKDRHNHQNNNGKGRINSSAAAAANAINVRTIEKIKTTTCFCGPSAR